MLKALVIHPPRKDYSHSDLIAIAVATAQKTFKVEGPIKVKALPYVHELGVYVAVVETAGCSKVQGCEDQRKRKR